MKKILILLTAIILSTSASFAQCRYFSWAAYWQVGNTYINFLENLYNYSIAPVSDLSPTNNVLFSTIMKDQNFNKVILADRNNLYIDDSIIPLPSEVLPGGQTAAFLGIEDNSTDNNKLFAFFFILNQTQPKPIIYFFSDDNFSQMPVDFPSSTKVITFSASDTSGFAVMLSTDDSLLFYRITEANFTHHAEKIPLELPQVNELRISPSGKYLAISTEQGVYLYEVNLNYYDQVDQVDDINLNFLRIIKQDENIVSAEFSPNDYFLYTLDALGKVEQYDIVAGMKTADVPVIDGGQFLQLGLLGNLYLFGKDQIQLIDQPCLSFAEVNHLNPQNALLINTDPINERLDLPCGIYPIVYINQDYSIFDQKQAVIVNPISKVGFIDFLFDGDGAAGDTLVDFSQLDYNILSYNANMNLDNRCDNVDAISPLFYIGTPVEKHFFAEGIKGPDMYLGPNKGIVLSNFLPSDLFSLSSTVTIKIIDNKGRYIGEFEYFKGSEWNGTTDSQTLPSGLYWYYILYENQYFYGSIIITRQ